MPTNFKKNLVEIHGLATNTLRQLDIRGMSLLEAFTNLVKNNNVILMNESLDRHETKYANVYVPDSGYFDLKVKEYYGSQEEAEKVARQVYESAIKNYPSNPDVALQLFFQFTDSVKIIRNNLLNLWMSTGRKDILVNGDVYRQNDKLVGNVIFAQPAEYNRTLTYKDKIDKVEFGTSTQFSDWTDAAANANTILGQLSSKPFGKIQSDYFRNLVNKLNENYKNGLLAEDIYKLELAKIVTSYNNSNDPTVMNENPSYNPGFSRPPDPELRKIPLEIMLQQNLLLPTDYLNTKFSFPISINPNKADSADNFKNTYLKNRGTANGRFKDGIIAGTAIKDIEEPYVDNSGKTVKAFSFADDAKDYHPDRVDRGFISNIDVNQDKLLPAVLQSDVKGFDNFFKLAGFAKNVNSDLFRLLSSNEAILTEFLQSLEPFGFIDNQLFPFLFETENRNGDEFKQYCFFQAAINSIQESFNPNWSSKTFFGRTEPVYTYVNTERNIDLRFVIFASSMRELQNIYERVNWLAQQTYGSFDSSNNPSRLKTGPLIRITVGDQFQRIPGFIRNLNFNWDHSGKWELTKGLRMLQTVEVSFSLQVIHQSLPDRNTDFYWGLEEGMHKNNSKLIPLTRTGNPGTPQEDFIDLLQRNENGG